MKKLLSLILALITLLSVATVMTGAAEADVAQTSATYYVSNTPYENVTNANIIGYLGDVDNNTDVSILDATEIQLSLASLTTLTDKQKNLADTDRDGGISILDATAIQCFIAKIPTDAKVAHTLYTKNSAPSSNIYEQVKNYIKANGTYSKELNWYTIYGDSSDMNTGLIYIVDDNKIAIAVDTYSGSTSISLFFTVPVEKNEYDYNSFMANKYVGNEHVYDTYGEAKQLKSTDRKLTLTDYLYESEKNYTFAQVEPEIQSTIAKGFADIEKKSNGKITNLYQLFG